MHVSCQAFSFGGDLVVYMAEMLPEMKDIKLLIVVIGGVLSQGNNQTSFMVGPEAVRALHEKGMVE